MSQEAPPGPTGAPFIGSLLPYLNDRLEFLESCAEYGDVVKRTVRGEEAYLLFHPDHVGRVLLEDDDKFWKQTFGQFDADQSCGNPFVTPEDRPWEERLELLAPVFARENVESSVDLVSDRTDAKVSDLAVGEPVDVLTEMEELVDHIAVDVVFGEHGVDDVSRISRGYQDLTERLITRRRIVPLWAPTPGNWRAKRSAEYLMDVFEEMITAVREDEDSEALLAAMLEAADADLSTEYVRNELLVMFGGAHETTGLALTYMWYLVAKHPEVQRRVQREADAVLGDDLPGRSELDDLAYVEKVIRETLRLYPPVFLTSRTAKEAVTFDGYTVPEGGRIMLPQWVIQRDERWYDDPDTFDPDRWTDEFEAEVPDFAYFPFSGGPKRCVGRPLATVLMKVVLARTLQRADVELASDPDLDLQTSMTLKPADPVEMTVAPRDR